MGYEKFLIRDIKIAKIVQNATKFGVENMQNEEIINTLLNLNINLDESDRQNVENIFKTLINLEEKVQLSR